MDDILTSAQTAITPTDRWMEDARRRLVPSEVSAILENALSGDLADQQRLFATMVDTWPRLASNMRTLRDAAKAAPFCVHAGEMGEDEPTDEAQSDKELVERALWGTKPQVQKLEMGMEGLFGKFGEADVTGHEVCEVVWHRAADGFIFPRCYRAVNPWYWGYKINGTEPDQLMLRAGGRMSKELTEFPLHKYLISIQPGHGGHPSVAASLRALAKYWIASVFGVEWLLQYAQLFNVPFRWANYPANDPAAKSAVCSMLSSIGTAGWAAMPEGVTLELKESTKAAGDLPSKLLTELADAACDIVVLGQTLTTGDGGGSGSYALGKVHAAVRRDRLESVCKEIATQLTLQLVPSIIFLNTGKTRLVYPEIRCDMPEERDAKIEAERDKILKEMGMELPLSWLYERHGVPMPADGEAVLGDQGTGDRKQQTGKQGQSRQPGQSGQETGPDGEPVTAAAKNYPDLAPGLADLYEEILKTAALQGVEAMKAVTEG